MYDLDKRVFIGEAKGTPLGTIFAAMSERGLVAVQFPSTNEAFTQYLQRLGYNEIVRDQGKVQSVLYQLVEYLEGKRRFFDLPIDWSSLSPFQQQVLRETVAIPYGQTVTYGELARQISRPRAARAVGRAQATNPMPLVIPCHRVLGADGGLHGYGAGKGLETKDWLLHMEADNLARYRS